MRNLLLVYQLARFIFHSWRISSLASFRKRRSKIFYNFFFSFTTIQFFAASLRSSIRSFILAPVFIKLSWAAHLALLHDIPKFIVFNVHFQPLLTPAQRAKRSEAKTTWLEHKCFHEFGSSPNPELFILSPAGARVKAHFVASFSPCHRFLFFAFLENFYVFSVSRIHTESKSQKFIQPAEIKPVLKKKNSKNKIHAGRSEEEKKCVKVGRIKIAIKIRYYSTNEKNKESRSFRTISERSLFTLESFYCRPQSRTQRRLALYHSQRRVTQEALKRKDFSYQTRILQCQRTLKLFPLAAFLINPFKYLFQHQLEDNSGRKTSNKFSSHESRAWRK